MDSLSSIKSDDLEYMNVSRRRSSSGVDTVLEDIVQALNSWSRQIFAMETDLQRNLDVKRAVTDALQRQVLDGLIKQEDANELQYILNLWTNLHRAYSCKQIGADFADQEVLSNLLFIFYPLYCNTRRHYNIIFSFFLFVCRHNKET